MVGVFVVPRLVSKSSALYGTIGVFFALVAWLWLFGRLVVFITIIETLRGIGTDRSDVRLRPASLPEHE